MSWLVPDWPAPARVRALVTTREGGVSAGAWASFNLGAHVGDEARAVAANRARLREALPAEPLWLEQVHGTTVAEAGTATLGARADASVARAAGRVLAVQSADCLPVLLCDRRERVVAAAHAGWRGLAAGVLEQTVLAMKAPPEDLLAFLGPAIGPGAYEVGAEVRAAFMCADPAAAGAFTAGREGKFFADLYALARQRLAKAGIMAVFGGTHCTFNERDRFFSYRRDGVTGRMASLVWLEPS
jgi:YfiH family protein